MDIGIAYDGTPESEGVEGTPDDRFEEYDPESTIAGIEAALWASGHVPRRLGGGRRFLEQVLANPYVMLGTTEQMVERIQLWRERLGVSYLVIYAEYMRAFAPVVTQLAGK